MGSYTANLFRKNKAKRAKVIRDSGASRPRDLGPSERVDKHEVVRLVECGIMRGGVLHKGHQSHGAIRHALGDEDPYTPKRRPDDTEGFITSVGEFVSRRDAMEIGSISGQCQMMGRELLSSDINW